LKIITTTTTYYDDNLTRGSVYISRKQILKILKILKKLKKIKFHDLTRVIYRHSVNSNLT